jgi:orotate phosphoribosyltransferase
MTIVARSPEHKKAGETVAKILLEIEAINFRPKEPYILTSGKASPVYIDCRKLISFNRARRTVMTLAKNLLQQDAGFEVFDYVAGGETAGIPYAAWMADEIEASMLYVRKKPKGFGRNAQIEGYMEEGKRVLLVEDLATDGGSKLNFVNALRAAGAQCDDAFVVFFYGVIPGALEALDQAGVTLHYLCNWWDVLHVAEKGNYFSQEDVAGVKVFLEDPLGWSAKHGGK